MNNPDSLALSAAAPAAVTNRRRWLVVGLLFVASLINYLDRSTISIALPLISADLHLAPAREGLLLSSFFWSYAFMQVPVGWCADRFNLRWLYAGAFVLWSVAQGLCGLATGLGMLIAFRIALGIGESIYLPGGTKIVSLLFSDSERGLPCGLFDFGTRIGLVLGGVLVPWLLGPYGWRGTFMLVGFVALLWLPAWLAGAPKRLGGRSGSGSIAARPASNTPRRTVTFNRNLLGICLGFFCFDYYWYLLVTWLPNYLVTVRHLSILRAGIYAALPFFVFGASEPIGGWIADRLIRFGWNETRTRKGIVTVAFLTGLLLIPAARAATPTAAILLIVGASLVGLSTGNLIVILQACAPHDEVGIWTGFENFAGNLGGILAPLATGILIQRTGSYLPGFVLAAVVLVAGLLAYWFVVGELKPPERAPSP